MYRTIIYIEILIKMHPVVVCIALSSSWASLGPPANMVVVYQVQMFAPNVGQASRAGRTEKKKKDYTTPLDL